MAAILLKWTDGACATINKMEGEEQVQTLVDMMGNFSIHSTPSGDYQVLNLV
jgi:hypothetical protein